MPTMHEYLRARRPRRPGTHEVAMAKMPPIIPSWLTSQIMGVAPKKESKQLYEANLNWVFTAINKIAVTVAMTPLKIYKTRERVGTADFKTKAEKLKYIKRGIKEDDIAEAPSNHQFYEVMRRPCPGMTRIQLWWVTVGRLNLLGKCAWHHVNNGLGVPGRIFVVPMTLNGEIRPVADRVKYVSAYHLQDGDVNTDLKPEEVVFFRKPDLGNPFDGYSPLQALSYPYDVDLLMLQQFYALFKNRAIPGILFETEGNMRLEQLERITGQWKSEHEGALKQGKTGFLPAGIKLREVGQKAKEFQGEQIMRAIRDRLLAGWGVPAGKLGMLEDVSRANLDGLDTLFIRETVLPEMKNIEEQLEADFLPLFDKNFLANFDLEAPEDKEMKLKEGEYRSKNFISTPNQIRQELFGQEPVPWGDKLYLPNNVIPIDVGKDGQMQPGIKPPEEPKKPGEEEGQETKPEEGGEGNEGEGQEGEEGREPTEEELKTIEKAAGIFARTSDLRSGRQSMGKLDNEFARDRLNVGRVHPDGSTNREEVGREIDKETSDTERLFRLQGGMTDGYDRSTGIGNTFERKTDRVQSLGKSGALPMLADTVEEKAIPGTRQFWTEARKEIHWKAFVHRADANERVFASTVRLIFQFQRDEMLRNLDRVGPRIQMSMEGWSKRAVVQKAGPKMEEILYSFEDYEKIANNEMKPLLEKIVQENGQNAMDVLGVHMVFNLENPRAKKFVGDRMKKFWSQTEDTTRKKITKTLKEGFSEGESIWKLKQRIRDEMNWAGQTRAKMIARTETIHASNMGALEGYRQSGVVEGKEWLTALDERTCFLKYIQVLTPSGNKWISRIREGDTVLTMNGPRKVIKTHKYRTGKKIISEFGATEDHPYWVRGKGWTKLKSIESSDEILRIDPLFNQTSEITSIFDLFLADSDDVPFSVNQESLLANVPRLVPMPIGSINLDGHKHQGDSEINGIRTDGIFTRIREFKLFKGIFDFLLNGGLAVISSITDKGAKTFPVFTRRYNSKSFITCQAINIYRRAITCFRTVGATFVRSFIKCFSTSLAFFIFHIFQAAFKATNFKSMFNRSVNLKRFLANWTGFHDFLFKINSIITFSRTIKAFTDLTTATIYRFSACAARNIFPVFICCMVTFPRTVFNRGLIFLDLILRNKFFSAIFTFIHQGYSNISNRLFQVTVYNLTIEGNPTFFADGILVHNCPTCAPMNGQVIGLDSDFGIPKDVKAGKIEGVTEKSYKHSNLEQSPPLHPSCRCVLLPVLEKVELPEQTEMPAKLLNEREWEKSLSKEQKQAIRRYTSQQDFTAFRAADKGLTFEQAKTRYGVTRSQYDRATKNLDHIYESLKTSERFEGIAYRGLHDLKYEDLQKILKAEEISWDALASGSSERIIANRFVQSKGDFGVLFKIKSKTSVKIDMFSKWAGESETLWTKGSKFKVRNVTKIPRSEIPGTKAISTYQVELTEV